MPALRQQPREPPGGGGVTLWLDAHLSPQLCPWLQRKFGLRSVAVRDLALREARDSEIFTRARRESVVVFTKDEDFVELVRGRGAPPQVLWLRCGNMSNARLKVVLERTLPAAIALLEAGEPVVEITLAARSPSKRTKR